MTDPDHQGQLLKYIPLFFLFSALEAFGSSVYLMSLPADPKNELIFGYSMPRLLIILGLLFLFIFGLSLAWYSFRRPARVKLFAGRLAPDQPIFKTVLILSGVIFMLGWAIVFTPQVYFGQYSPYFIRLRPALVWLTLVSLQTALFLLLWGYGLHWAQALENYRQNKKAYLLSGILLVCFLAVWALIAVTRVGLTPDLFWGKTGIPLLNLQVLAALVIGLLFLALSIRYQNSRTKLGLFLRGWRIDLLICLVLWLAAAFFWIREPLPHSHFAPGPYPPNNAVYPYSDAASYDLAAQFAIIGQGFSGFKNYIDKPLYSAFLVFLHVVMGQSYQQVIALQVAFLAVIPALLYLIGQQLFNRTAGVMAGTLTVFKGINSISGTLAIWDVSNSKMMMSETPLAAALLLFTLFMILWLKDPDRRVRYLMAAGGVIGLATLIRHNTWILLAAAWFVIILVYWRRWKKWLRAGLLFTIVLVVSILPWMWQSGQATHNPFYFLAPIRGVVLSNRYAPYLPSSFRNLIYPPGTKGSATATPTPSAGATPLPSGPSAAGKGVESQNLLQSIGVFTAPIAGNFVHDLVTSTLTLPSSFFNQDIIGLVRQQQPSSYWNTIWDGRMNAAQGVLLFLDLCLLAIGITNCWYRWKLAGIMPLITFLAYSLGTAVARTSGGRYIAPMDWAIYFYYGLGLLQVVLWGAALFGAQIRPALLGNTSQTSVPLNKTSSGTFAWPSFALLAGFFAIGALVPLPQYLFPRLYPTLSKPDIVQMLDQRGAVAETGYSLADLQQFAAGKKAVVAYGRALYPRYLDFKNDDKANEVNSGLPKSSRYLVFDLVGPGGLASAALPISAPPQFFPNASEVAVIGCKTGSMVYPFAVVILDPQVTVYKQNVALPVSCPTK
jgi:hypothetical protein